MSTEHKRSRDSFGGQIPPLSIQKTPIPGRHGATRAVGYKHSPCGSPSSSRALKDARAPHKKQLLARDGAGNGISPGVGGSAVRGMLTGAVFLKLPSLSLPDTFQRYLFHFKRKNVLSARPRGDNQPGDG